MGFTLEAEKTYKEAGIRTRGEHTTHAHCKQQNFGTWCTSSFSCNSSYSSQQWIPTE
jgi:hypothetical protein